MDRFKKARQEVEKAEKKLLKAIEKRRIAEDGWEDVTRKCRARFYNPDVMIWHSYQPVLRSDNMSSGFVPWGNLPDNYKVEPDGDNYKIFKRK